MRLKDCHNFQDFRTLAKRRLPAPIFNYIDGAADDEVTHNRNTEAFEKCDLVPNVLRGVDEIDLSVTVMGQKLDMPLYCSPTAVQRLFHHDGEWAVGAAAEKFGTMFGVSTFGTASAAELRKKFRNPQCFQFYFHHDRGLNSAMLQRAKEAGVEVMMLTVDTIVGGNRERDIKTGFSVPYKLNLRGLMHFAIKPAWGINYLTHEPFSLPNVREFVEVDKDAGAIANHISQALDPSMNWSDVEKMVAEWDGQFCLKGIMSVEDAKKAADIGCTGIILSNHGGRQLDGSRAPFDQLSEIVDAVGDRVDVIMDSGIQRGTHVLKALSLGAKAVGGGRFYLYPLAAAGQPGVERALELMHAELTRGMQMMGCTSVDQLSRENLRFR